MKLMHLVLLFLSANTCILSGNGTTSDKRLTVTIGFMGDIMLGRVVNEKLATVSSEYPWGDFIPILKKNDLNVINLECALTTSTMLVPKFFNFKADPDRVKVLTAGSINVANLANNHILDFSYPGMEETIRVLDKAGIYHVGAGNNLQEAQKPAIITKNGIKIGIIGCTDNEPGWSACKNKAGVNYFYICKPDKILQLIKKTRPLVDILILTLHWGPNMREKPTKAFREFAHVAIDAGVDIMHGSSAHIVQPIEFYKGKLIMYDTGDFIDDYAVDPQLRNDRTALFLVTINKSEIKKVQLIPGLISKMQVNQASSAESEKFIKHLNKLSESFGTTIVQDKGQLVVKPCAKKS